MHSDRENRVKTRKMSNKIENYSKYVHRKQEDEKSVEACYDQKSFYLFNKFNIVKNKILFCSVELSRDLPTYLLITSFKFSFLHN